MSELYNISSSPHIRAKDTSAKIMLYVIIALLPASIFGVYNFGLRALLLIAVCIATCVASEWIFEKIVHKKKEYDNRLQCRVNRIIISIEPSAYPSNLAGSTWKRVRDRHCQNVIRRTGSELYEPGTWSTLFPAGIFCKHNDQFYL